MITKQAYEEFFLYHEFRRSDGQGWLAVDEILTGTPVVTIKEKVAGTDTSSTMVSNISIDSSTRVKYKLKGGTAGIVYLIHIQVVTSASQKFEDDLELVVR